MLAPLGSSRSEASLHILSQSVEFTEDPPASGAVEAYLAASRATERVRPALLSNPMARTNWRSVGHARLLPLMPDKRACLETPSVGAVRAAINYLLFERHANVLVINGGDGTIHHAINAAVWVTRRAAEVAGRPVPLPRFLFMRGGGMNMLARVFKSRGHPRRTLRRFQERARGAALGALPTREVPLLEVVEANGEGELGYIFGSELVFNALTMYERFGQGYIGLARFLWEVGAGYTLHTELWRRYGHLLNAPLTPLRIDAQRYERYTSVVATTVPLQLLGGVVSTIAQIADPRKMNVVAVLAIDKGEVIRMIPKLMIGAASEGVRYVRGVSEIALTGSYTIDGERVNRVMKGDGPNAEVRVRGARPSVHGIWLA